MRDQMMMNIGQNPYTEKWYITTCRGTRYLRKDGRLHISTYHRKESEGYWDTEEEAMKFLLHWQNEDLIGVDVKSLTTKPDHRDIVIAQFAKPPKPESDWFGVVFIVLLAIAVAVGVFIGSLL